SPGSGGAAPGAGGTARAGNHGSRWAWWALPSTLGSAIGSAGPGIAVERIVGAAVGACGGVLIAREPRRPSRRRPEDAALVALGRQAGVGVDGRDQRLAGLPPGRQPRGPPPPRGE